MGASVLVCALAAQVPAFAGGVDPASATAVQREQAQQRFLRGKAQFDKNDYEHALDEFKASLEIVASPNARLYVARTLRELGRLVEAYAEYGRTAAEAKEHQREDGRYGKAADAALAERAAIAPQLAFVDIKIVNANDATTVNIGGSPLVRAGWAEPVPIKPGQVDVDVETPGVVHVRKTLTVSAGQKATFNVDAGVAANNPQDITVGAPPPQAKESGHTIRPGWMLPAAVIGGGVGVVGMLIFTVAGVASNGTYSDLKNRCGLGPCAYALQSEVSTGKTQQAVANTGLIIGLVGLAAGGAFLTLWLLGGHSSTTASASVTVGPGSLGVAGTF